MEEDSVLSIEEAFGDLKDPRSHTPTHNLQEMLVVALCAILCGAETWVGIQVRAQDRHEWLRRFVPLCNGVPSHDTFGRVFAAREALRSTLRLVTAERDLAEERLKAFRRELFGAKSEARGADQLDLFNEAEALACETDYPHLVFPALALEKVRVATNWHERQGLIRRRDASLAFAA